MQEEEGVTDGLSVDGSATVPSAATPADATQARWAWVAPEVWTARMLTALDQGVRGGRWHTLIDKVYALTTLHAAFTRVKAAWSVVCLLYTSDAADERSSVDLGG